MCLKCSEAIKLSKILGYHGCGKIIHYDKDIYFCTGVKSHLRPHTTACRRAFQKAEVEQIDADRLDTKIFIVLITLIVTTLIWLCL